ncbi:L-threonine 3-dehydrogenase [Cohnella zeiphila]|uniref:L-threonine 3-dehydrogenase n=1 Tax=Cohnella zeiphila TaxID=2761120 RepID=A0A7X0SLT4_9BACL|nr:L-threonine 3-dehydrogenase [Cohnella zeiphila]MBB6732357.1 L-threonine 3-dehydrogenase [Cohnella zeiphila]
MSGTMTALVKDKRAAGATLKNVPIPQCGAREVLVKVKASSICGTDRHIYEWDAWAERTVVTPNVFGHEFAGVVEAVGEQVSSVKPGDLVSGEGHIACGLCKACRTGHAHVCPHTRSFGITAPGCFAEYALLREENVIRNSADLPLEVACLQDPFGNAVQTVLAGDIAGKSVAVIGAGAIGLMAVAAAKACGAGTIIAVDVNDYKLRLAAGMGADHVLNSSLAGDAAADRIRDWTGGEGAEVVLEMSGHPAGIRVGLEAAAQAARVSLLGIPTQPVPIDVARHIIFKGLRIDGITGRRLFGTWYQMKGLLDNGRVDLRPLVTHRFPLDRYEEAFELVRSGACGKVVFIH